MAGQLDELQRELQARCSSWDLDKRGAAAKRLADHGVTADLLRRGGTGAAQLEAMGVLPMLARAIANAYGAPVDTSGGRLHRQPGCSRHGHVPELHVGWRV